MRKAYKLIALVLLSIFFIILFSVLAYSSSSGITGLTRKTTGLGCYCHGSTPTSGVIVNFTGPDSVAPGQTLIYTLTITGGPLVRGGTDIAVGRGVIDTIGPQGLRKVGAELTHSSPKAPNGGMVSFQFKYTAPAALGRDTLYAVGNSVNYDFSSGGDQWNHAAGKIIIVRNPVGIINNTIPNKFQLNQNYPNPFNPNTIIRFKIKDSRLTILKVFDVLGREVQTLVNEQLKPGTYEVDFNGENLPSGVYYYKLVVGDPSASSGQVYTETRKMVLIK